jgi:tRNA pseudouridine13 synthase
LTLHYDALPLWAYAYGSPLGKVYIRQTPEDFQVTEHLAFEPSGEGEHVFLFIEKRHENTAYIARLLARHAGVRQRDVSYAGLKDRHALTRQWFSVWLPGKKEPHWTGLNSDTLHILKTTRHTRKLKRGALKKNYFQLTLRNWTSPHDALEQRLAQIKTLGVPNYFGEQRFGHGGQNVNKALSVFRGEKAPREQISLYLSAARSFLFNEILAYRVAEKLWHTAISGDAFMLEGSNSCFSAESIDDAINQRIASGDIHPTGVLWGKGTSIIHQQALAIEESIIQKHAALSAGLLAHNAERSLRALRVNVCDLSWSFPDPQTIQLTFHLPAGSFATAVLRECVHWD